MRRRWRHPVSFIAGGLLTVTVEHLYNSAQVPLFMAFISILFHVNGSVQLALGLSSFRCPSCACFSMPMKPWASLPFRGFLTEALQGNPLRHPRSTRNMHRIALLLAVNLSGSLGLTPSTVVHSSSPTLASVVLTL